MITGIEPPLQTDIERKVIRIFFKNLFNSQPDPNFETDARVFQCGEENLLFTTDEFSSEDNFRDHDPAALGWNVAAATLNDILAAGGLPMFYGHCVIFGKDWNLDFIEGFSKGIASCLKMAGVDFLGGDIGNGPTWSYVGIAIGRQLKPITRRGALAGDAIYITGNIGSGNLEAALKLYSGRKTLRPLLNRLNISFPMRLEESELIRKYAHCCMDTSDGLLRALLDFSRINHTGFIISNVPYCREGLLACKLLNKPKELLFLGECGEYELVFTIPNEKEEEFLADARHKKVSFSKLGYIISESRMAYNDDRTTIDLTGYDLFARNYPDVEEYIDRLVQFVYDAKQRY